jgi:chemotaxis protein CheD
MTNPFVLTVGISDCIVSRDPAAVLTTHALGSCIAVAIYDPVAQVAGLLHFMLPESSMDREKAQAKPFMFADTGIPKLFHGAYNLGAVKQRLIVTVLGGAQVLDTSNTFNIGKRNYLAIRKILWKAAVLVHHEDVGGTLPRSVRMQVGTGRIVLSHGRDEREITQRSNERTTTSHGV